MLTVDSKAPDFNLKGSDGKMHSLSEFSGKNLVLYFYPRDNTPGCTMEARTFSAKLGEIRDMGADVVGVSDDNFESHCKFVEKQGLKLLLLSDTDRSVMKKYDAYGDKGIFGMGTLRKTYVIGKEGKIIKIFPKVNPMGHEKEVMEFLKTIN